jgi:hypothetical protein
MAFKIALSQTYKKKVTVEIANEHGKMEKSDFVAEFKRVLGDDLDELRKLTGKEVLRQVLVGAEGIKDEDNQTIEFSEAVKESLLAIPQAAVALVETFYESVYKAKEKN